MFAFSVVVVLVAVVVNAAVCKIARPFHLLSSECREKQRIAAQLETVRAENRAIDRRTKYLQTPQGAAQAARKLGYVKPGEITLILPADTPDTRP